MEVIFGGDDCFLGLHEDGFLFVFGDGLVGGDVFVAVILDGDGFVDCGGDFVAVNMDDDGFVDCGVGFVAVILDGDGFLYCRGGFMTVILCGGDAVYCGGGSVSVIFVHCGDSLVHLNGDGKGNV